MIGPNGPGALAESYARALERLECDVYRFDSDRALQTASQFSNNRVMRRIMRPLLWTRVNNSTVEIARCVKPGLVLAVKCCYLHPETVRFIRVDLGIPIVNYYPDHPYCGVPLDPREGASTQRCNLIEVFREYNAVWTWEKRLVERLCRDGVNASYLPFGVDADLFYPRKEPPSPCVECRRDHDVIFIGHYNRKRGAHISAIRRHSVALWGVGWSRLSPEPSKYHRIHTSPTFGAATSLMHLHAEISLNVVGDLNIPGHNMRTFEIPASGGIMLADYSSQQAEFFPEDEAAAYYRTPSELDDKIDRLLCDAELRDRIRRNGASIAAEHTYDRRASVILREMGLSH